jgi:NAD(P)H-hydrate epimerase
MGKIYSVEEIQNIEKKEFKKLKSSYVLMKRAGTTCAKNIYKSKLNSKFIVLCGPGNNGGDGLVISQALKKLNQNVILYCLEFITYKGDAKIAYKKNRLTKNNYNDLNIPKNSVIIDCLFGIGLNRKVKGMYKNIIKKVNNSKQHVISIDIPSGINGNNGKIMGEAIKANSTYTLHAKKIGLTVNSGMKYSGKVSIIDIGIK